MTDDKNAPHFQIKAKRPDEWADRSLTIFTKIDESGETDLEPNTVISRDSMTKEETFKLYSNRQVEALETDLPQFDLIKKRDGKIRGYPAIDIACRWMSPGGRIQQRLVFLSVGKGELITFAATAADDDFENHTKMFNAVLGSIEVEGI